MFCPPDTKLWFPSCDFHTLSFMQASSAISFRLPPASISAAASSGSPLMFCFRFPSFSRPDFSRPIAASSQLSDPRCFRFLSSASVLGSDYSASVSSVPSLPVFASQGLLQCAVSAFASSAFHLISCLVSHAFFPIFCTWLYCMFLFALPCFAPTAVPQVLTFAFAPVFSVFLPHSFVCFRFTSGYLAYCFFRSIYPRFLPHSGFFASAFPLSLTGFSFSDLPGFPCFSSNSMYLAFRLFPFVLPSFAPTAVPLVLTLHFFRVFVLCFLLSFVRFCFRN